LSHHQEAGAKGSIGRPEITKMKMSARASIIILLTAVIPAWAQPPTLSKSTIPPVSEIATTFTNYYKITTNTVFVNPELAMLCRGASKEEVDAARVKFGPHANTGILIYMNRAAAEAFRTNAGAFPEGAVIVKQNPIRGYRKDGKWIRDADTGVGGMVKHPAGYDPAHGDWEYFYFEDVKKIESGRITSCVQCHESAKSKDYVFGTWLKPQTTR
jgi:hypothetical protein